MIEVETVNYEMVNDPLDARRKPAKKRVEVSRSTHEMDSTRPALIVLGWETTLYRISLTPEPTEKEYVVLSLRAIGFGIGTVKYLWRKIA